MASAERDALIVIFGVFFAIALIVGFTLLEAWIFQLAYNLAAGGFHWHQIGFKPALGAVIALNIIGGALKVSR